MNARTGRRTLISNQGMSEDFYFSLTRDSTALLFTRYVLDPLVLTKALAEAYRLDLNTGKLLWKVPLGEHEALTRKGVAITGTENFGGASVTAGGLVFAAGTRDSKIRAFDAEKNFRFARLRRVILK